MSGSCRTPPDGQTTLTFCCRLLSVLLLVCSPATVVAVNKCTTCKDIVKNVKQGLKDTAKSNFGGGNTNWEEKHLGAYAFSETRLVEILEKGCDSSGKECHSMLEAAEEILEDWWFKHYGKKKDTDLHEFLCINQIKACCHSGRYGPTCEECPGGVERPCKDNGVCDGNGTREGKGTCVCHPGYQGTLCDDCKFGYFEVEHNDTHTECEACHKSCKGSCTEDGPKGCSVCKDGWTKSEEEGCLDINECEAEEAPCEGDQYCENNEGSYKCTACDAACEKCTSSGPDSCVECSQRYYRDENTCKKCDISCTTSCTDGTTKGCDSCSEGWVDTEDEGCQDINECDESNSCSEDEYCTNSPGSFRCSTCHYSCQGCTGAGAPKCKECKEGFERDEKNTCKDIDECARNDTCTGAHEKCLNSPGSYTCQCGSDFKREGEACVPKETPKPPKKKKKKKKFSAVGRGKCKTCQEIVENVYSGIMQTSKSNFGGGNTKWEEAKLGSYEYSETRLTEILQSACPDEEHECFTMLENNEERIEKWWFNEFAKEENMDLYTWLCIDRIQVCCPNGTAGPECRECTGGRERPCRGNGECFGEGTRIGNGVCNCTVGYTGWDCADCDKLYYEELKNDTHTICKSCDEACATACFDEGKQGCEDCKEGWEFVEEQGCKDVNECENSETCSGQHQSCLNTAGSYRCDCDPGWKMDTDNNCVLDVSEDLKDPVGDQDPTTPPPGEFTPEDIVHPKDADADTDDEEMVVMQGNIQEPVPEEKKTDKPKEEL